ncbi:MAG: response regulator transcription factor [Deltaproteobacteria bacterium]|nr:response regulator transcription factor [Deltaproteobacteria bacterium]
MKHKTILLVEDDSDIAALVDWHLKAEGFSTTIRNDGNAGLETAMAEKPDLILLDLMLPGIDGLSICKTLKRSRETEHIPIIMLTARGEEVDRIVGFELGADDYMVKPFSPRELVLRVLAVLKRMEPDEDSGKQTSLKYKDLILDPERFTVKIGEKKINLTATEFRLLKDLIENRGKVRTRDNLLDRVWGYRFDGYARTVDTHIRRLRSKLGDYADGIETVRGVGYRFTES